MKTTPENISFPKAIWWYPGSGSDFFAAAVPYLMQQRWRDEQQPLTEAAPEFLTEQSAYPIVFNDADTSLMQLLEDCSESEVLFEDFGLNFDLVGYGKMEWKQLGMIRVTLHRKDAFEMDLPIAVDANDSAGKDQTEVGSPSENTTVDESLPEDGPLSTDTTQALGGSLSVEKARTDSEMKRPARTWSPPQQDAEHDPRQLSFFREREHRTLSSTTDERAASSSIQRFKRTSFRSEGRHPNDRVREKRPTSLPQRLRLTGGDIPEGHIRVKLMELEIRFADPNVDDDFVQPCWFVLSDVLDFAESVAPALGTEIKALALLRTRCSRNHPVRNTDNLGKVVLNHFYRKPDAFKKLQFAWFDGTVRDVRSRWNSIRFGRPEQYRKPGESPFEVLVPPRLKDDLATDFLPAWQRINYWGGTRMGSALHYPAHRYGKPTGMGDFPVFWVVPGLLMGGCWPAGEERDATRAFHETLFNAGIRTFVNLVPEKESDRFKDVTNYERYANALARERNIRIKHHALPMINGGLMLDPEALDDTLAYITKEMELGRGVYVHGKDGVGRTGTVLAAWLHGNRLANGLSAVKLLNAFRLAGGLDVVNLTVPQMEYLEGLSPVLRKRM